MAIQLGSAYGKVNIDSSGVTKGINSAKESMGSLESSAKRLGATLQNVGKAMTAAITIPLALMAKEAVMTASAYEESLNKMKVVFGENADAIEEWSKSSVKNLGMTKQQALEAAATFGNLFTSMGLARDQSADMSMNLTQLAIDLASFNNISVDEALVKLRAGLVGETEPLRTLGVNLTQATVEAKAFEMGLADANGELSYSALLQARYALILEQTTNAQGDFARTSESLANQIRVFRANWGETLRILGDMLLPIVTKLLIQFNKFLDWFNNAPPHIQKLVGAILLLLFVAGPLMMVFGKLLPLAFSGATKSLNPFSGGIFGLIGTFVKWIGIAAMVVKVLGALGIATGPVGAAILSVNAAIAGVGASLLSILGPILLIIGALALLYWAFSTNFMGIRTTAEQLWFILKYFFTTGWQFLVQLSQQRAMQLLTAIKNLVERIKSAFKNVNWAELGKWVIMGLANGLLGGLPLIVMAASKIAKAALETIKKTLGIASDSKEAIKLGKFTYSGFATGIEQMAAMKNPDIIARAFAKPVQNTSSMQQQNVTMQFANGLTVRQAQRMMAENNEMMLKRLNSALGGA